MSDLWQSPQALAVCPMPRSIMTGHSIEALLSWTLAVTCGARSEHLLAQCAILGRSFDAQIDLFGYLSSPHQPHHKAFSIVQSKFHTWSSPYLMAPQASKVSRIAWPELELGWLSSTSGT